jgi:uncharacterized protein YjiS (DUF1127 family)
MFKLATFRSDAAFWPLATPPTPAARPSSLLSAMLTAPRRLGTALLSELRARRAMGMLEDLDERMLRDIGLERDQIAHACRRGRKALLRSSDLHADIARWS